MMKSGRRGGGGGAGGGRLFPFCSFRAKSRFQSLCGLGCLALLGLLLLLHQLPGSRPTLVNHAIPHHVVTTHPPGVPPARNLMEAVTPARSFAVPMTNPDLMTCPRKKHVMFLKVHKSGSTTVANILQRFALRESLNVLLPNRLPGTYGFNVLSRSASLPPHTLIPAPPGQQHHVVCNHMVYNRTALDELLPKDTVYVAVAREPEARFVSAMAYYGMLDFLSKITQGRSNGTPFMFSEYLAQPELFGQPPEVFNTLAFNLGVPADQYHNLTFLQDFVRRLDREFALLMLTEKLDEGLLMLRRLLCWDLRDIIYIKRNEGVKPPDYAMTESDRKLFRDWQEADYFLYGYFHQRFHRQLTAQGPDFFKELIYFRETQRRVRDFCIHNLDNFQEPLVVAASPYNARFTVTGEDCGLLLSDELTLVEELMKRAWARYHEAGGKLAAYANHVSETDPNSYYTDPGIVQTNVFDKGLEPQFLSLSQAADFQTKTIVDSGVPGVFPTENGAAAPNAETVHNGGNNGAYGSNVIMKELPPLPEVHMDGAGFDLQARVTDLNKDGVADRSWNSKSMSEAYRDTLPKKLLNGVPANPPSNAALPRYPLHADGNQLREKQEANPPGVLQGSPGQQNFVKTAKNDLNKILSRSSVGLDGAQWGSPEAGDPKTSEIHGNAISSVKRTMGSQARPLVPTMGLIPQPVRKIGKTAERSKDGEEKVKLHRFR